jgi:hypothetical protein
MNHEDWGEGPWNNEEDHAVWVDPTTGLDCMINRGPSGALCGYVGVPPSHPWHGRDYNDVDVIHVDVHGGLTYAAACDEDNDICHIPEDGREAEIWWFGFDCAHFGDVTPRMDADMRKMNERLKAESKPALRRRAVVWRVARAYKDWAYVMGECTDLAKQLAEVKE